MTIYQNGTSHIRLSTETQRGLGWQQVGENISMQEVVELLASTPLGLALMALAVAKSAVHHDPHTREMCKTLGVVVRQQ